MAEARDSRAQFPQTRWTLVHRVQTGGKDAWGALEELCQCYWFPLYGWARRSGSSPADAEDAVQGFFSDVVRKRLFEKADSEKGRLRTFLLTAFRRYHRDIREKAAAIHRGGDRVVSFDALCGEEWYVAEAAHASSADAFFDRQWALAVLERTMAQVESDYSRRGKGELFEQLHRYLTTEEEADYHRDGKILGLSVGAVKVAVHRLRDRFRQALRDEVASTQDENEDIEEELTHLLRALES